MGDIPRERALESTVAFLREGYDFGPRRLLDAVYLLACPDCLLAASG